MATEQDQEQQEIQSEERFRKQIVWVLAAGLMFILLLWLFTSQFNLPLS